MNQRVRQILLTDWDPALTQTSEDPSLVANEYDNYLHGAIEAGKRSQADLEAYLRRCETYMDLSESAELRKRRVKTVENIMLELSKS